MLVDIIAFFFLLNIVFYILFLTWQCFISIMLLISRVMHLIRTRQLHINVLSISFYLRSIYIYNFHIYTHICVDCVAVASLSLSLCLAFSHLVYKLTYFALRARHKEFHLPFNIKLKCTRGAPPALLPSHHVQLAQCPQFFVLPAT